MSAFRQRKAAERLQEARIAHARSDFATVEAAASAAVRLDPSLRAGWELWAESLERQSKLIEAARVLGEALEVHAEDPALQLSLAAAQIETGQFAGAERILVELRRRWPGSREPILHIARALRDIRALGRLRALLEHALTGPFADDPDLAALLIACKTWQAELPDERPALTSMRERLLSEHGVVLLGTGHDDGLTIPWYSTYLVSNYDVVATCARLRAFAEHFGWRWDRIAAIDPPAQVLAILLADALAAELVELPRPGGSARYPDPEGTLAVASFIEPGWGAGEHGRWALACAEAGGMFAFGVLDYARHDDPLPPLLGVAGGERVCLPWHRLGEARIGFSRFGLIDDLPAEIDGRSPERIADDYRRPLAHFELGPNLVAQLRHLLEHRHQLRAGLRQRSDFARILPHIEPRRGPRRPLHDALERGDMAEFLRALGILEGAVERIGERELELLEGRFRALPEVRSRLADLLYRLAPDRFASLLHELVARPEAEIPWPQRDGLLHLYGCNPWTGPVELGAQDPSRATAQLRRWLAIGSASNRSEIVQSKYGLHHLAEAPDFADILAGLLADEPAIVLGTLRWLHDEHAEHAEQVEQVLALLDHEHADVVFEALSCARVAGLALPIERLEPLLDGRESSHPRLISAAVEHLELSPVADAHPRLRELLQHEEPSIRWAAARSLLRGRDPLGGAELLAEGIVAREAAGLDIRQLLRALASADDYALFEPLLRSSDSPSLMKIVAAALTPALLGFDDPRLLEHLRRFSDAFGLDPPYGYASFLLRHGDPELDRDAVYGAQGSTDLRAGYEAKAALARWGDAEAQAELEQALAYASGFRQAALEAWFRVLHATDFERLDVAREADPKVVWTILTANVAAAPRPWVEQLAEHLRGDWQREAAWAGFIELRLRGQIPSKFVVAAQSADFAVLAELLPKHFADLCERTLAGTPDRLGVDLLEWLGEHRPDQAREWAKKLEGSPHWGLRQCALRLVMTRR
ncbi:MAG: hypothetical protein R6X02_04270 [Enhygromyxa sp.]